MQVLYCSIGARNPGHDGLDRRANRDASKQGFEYCLWRYHYGDAGCAHKYVAKTVYFVLVDSV